MGGVAPATGCDAAHAGTDQPVGYSANYYFYKGGGTAGDGGTSDGSADSATSD
jgi:hypothetical protein